MQDDLIFARHVEIRAIRDARGRYPAREWLEQLSARDRKRAEAGMINFDRIQAAGIRGAGRVEAVKGSRHKLLELKLTRGGTPGPQLRLLGVMQGRTFWAAHGLAKKEPRLKRGDIERAEALLDEWQEPRSRPRGEGAGTRR